MKILLDESLDVRLRQELPGHDVFTVGYMGWKGLKNGALLAMAAAAEGCEAFITTDRNIEYQQNVVTLPCTIFALAAASDNIEDLQVLVPNLLRALSQRHVKKIVHVAP